MITLIDRYILRQFLKSFFLVGLVLSFLVCILDLSLKYDDFLKHELSYKTIFHYYTLFLPFVLSYIMPITIFITTILMTSRMAAHTEIIAMFMGGMHFKRFLLPYLWGSMLIAGLSFYLNGWVVPNGSKYRVQFERMYVKRPFYFKQEDFHLEVGDDLFLYFHHYDNRHNRAYNVMLEQLNADTLQSRLYAQRMDWDTTLHKWTLRNWQYRHLHGSGENLAEGKSLDTTLRVEPRDFQNTYGMEEVMTIPELNAHIKLLETRGDSTVNKYEVAKYYRYMLPFSILLLTFMGVLLSVRKRRGSTGALLALGSGVTFFYIICFILAKSMAETGLLPPLLGIWLPNLIFMAFSIVLYYKLPR